MHFFLTRQERIRAEELRDQYRIVFVGDHAADKTLAECRVEILIDPVEQIFDRNRFILDAPRFHVTEKESEGFEISEDE